MPDLIDSKYDLAANTYTAKEQSFAVCEVGDAKSPDIFYPQIKIMRWNNEVNFSARLVTAELAPITALVGDEIQWAGAKSEARFYEIGDGKEGGGFEFEIILKEPPKSNVISMTIQTKGLNFCYQPNLTQAEIDAGWLRPANIVGSYAVYHKTTAGDYEAVGGKNYKAGKAFHIFRPRIEDAKGNWVWGDLNIDEKAGLLTVTIPQDFLTKAIYPVRHAAGLTFGYSTHGGSYLGRGADLIVLCGAYSPASNGNATRVTCYVGNWPGSINTELTLGIYNWSDPNYTKLKDTGAVIVTTTYDNPDEFGSDLDSPLSVLSSDSYWLALNLEAGKNIAFYSDSNAGYAFRAKPSTYVSGTLEASLTSPYNLYDDVQPSIWATYTPAAGGGVLIHSGMNGGLDRPSLKGGLTG